MKVSRIAGIRLFITFVHIHCFVTSLAKMLSSHFVHLLGSLRPDIVIIVMEEWFVGPEFSSRRLHLNQRSNASYQYFITPVQA